MLEESTELPLTHRRSQLYEEIGRIVCDALHKIEACRQQIGHLDVVFDIVQAEQERLRLSNVSKSLALTDIPGVHREQAYREIKETQQKPVKRVKRVNAGPYTDMTQFLAVLDILGKQPGATRNMVFTALMEGGYTTTKGSVSTCLRAMELTNPPKVRKVAGNARLGTFHRYFLPDRPEHNTETGTKTGKQKTNGLAKHGSLLEEVRAIVKAEPGIQRDAIRERMQANGFTFTGNPVEHINWAVNNLTRVSRVHNPQLRIKKVGMGKEARFYPPKPRVNPSAEK